MELALYHGEHGYYSNPARTRIGHTGDFATSVNGGQAFGRLLAIRLHDLSPEERNRDFLRQFQTLTHPAFFGFGSRFHVLEFSKGATSSGLSFPCPA